MRNGANRFPAACGWLAPGLVIFAVGAKLGLVHGYASDQPFADQWAAEGAALFRAKLYGPLGWVNFLGPHGEHHPALTRGLAYVLFLLNGRQWDNRVELVANLLIYAAFLWIVWLMAARLVGERWHAPAAGAAAVLFALPANRENFLWGFQSQFLFLLLCGAAHVYGTLRSRHLGWTWAGAQLAGLAGLFSIASGSMSAAALAGWAACRIWRKENRALNGLTLVANVLLIGLGLWLLPPGVGASASRAHSFGALFSAWGHLLSWPLPGAAWCLLVYLPLGVAVAVGIRRRSTEGEGGLLFVAGSWVALLALAIAFGRGATPDSIAVRYYDILVVGLFLNGLAAARLVSASAGGRRWLIGGLALAWVITVGWPLCRMNQPGEVGPLLAYHRAMAGKQARLVAKMIETRDAAVLSGDAEVRSRFPHFQLAVDLLLDPGMRPMLAPSLTADGHAGPLSRWAPRIASIWPILVGVGIILLMVGAVRSSTWLDPKRNPLSGTAAGRPGAAE